MCGWRKGAKRHGTRRETRTLGLVVTWQVVERLISEGADHLVAASPSLTRSTSGTPDLWLEDLRCSLAVVKLQRLWLVAVDRHTG